MTEIIVTTKQELKSIINNFFEEYLKDFVIQKQVSKRYMNLTEFCEYTGMAKSTVYAFTSKNRIPFIKRGKRLMFEKTKIDEWLR